jgi:hypothetical protein
MSTSAGTRSSPARQVGQVSPAQAARLARQALKQRGTDATQQLRDALNIATNPEDVALLGTALAEAAVREIARNSQFGREVRRQFDELVELRTRAGAPAKKPARLEPLEPIRYSTKPIDPFAPPDPADLRYVYGDDKLGRALQDYTLFMLKLTAEKVQAEHPGTKPANKNSKAAVIDYIVEYSGNGR